MEAGVKSKCPKKQKVEADHFLFLKTASPRYSQTMQFTHLKCTIQSFWVYYIINFLKIVVKMYNIQSTILTIFFKFLFIYLLMAVLGLRFCARASSRCGKRGPLFIAVRGPLTIAASLVAEHRLQTRRLSNCGSRA